jgi:predicted outer membrane repeat protein
MNQGGGLYCQGNSNPVIQQCVFESNISYAANGGALSIRDSEAVISETEFLYNISRFCGGAIYLRNSSETVVQPANRFDGNRGCGGNNIAAWSQPLQPIDARNNLFADGSALTEAWVLPGGAFDVSGHASAFEPLQSDVYVSPDGDDQINNGLSPGSPFRTIRHALSRIQTGNPGTLSVILAPGVYSTDTNGESYPLPLLSHVILTGPEQDQPYSDHDYEIPSCSDGFEQMDDNTARLYSSEAGGCIRIESVSGASIRHLVLNGNTGPGLFARNASATCIDLTISGFEGVPSGAGIYLESGATIECADTVIAGNHATVSGGGLFCATAASTFARCLFTGNSAVFAGGGVYHQSGSSHFDGCIFTENTAAVGGAVRIETGTPVIASGPSGGNSFNRNQGARGANLSASSVPSVPYAATGNVFDVSPDSAWSVAPADAFSTGGFTITGPEPLYGATVFVAINGSDENDGLTPLTAFRTISHALKRVVGLPDQPAAVFVGEGNYTLTGGERFPLSIPPFVTLHGEDSETTRITADNGNVIDFYHSHESRFENFSITSGTGPGVTIANCSPELSGLVVSGCSTEVNGAGIALTGASPQIQGSVFENNSTTRQGGAIHCGPGSEPSITGCLFSENTSDQLGGAILCGLNAHALISECVFQTNFAIRNGGAVAAYFGHVTIGGCHFFENRAARSGGAVYLSQPGSDLSGAPNTFTENAAPIGSDLAAEEPFAAPVAAMGNHFSGIPASEFYVAPLNTFDLSGSTGAEPIRVDVYVAPWGDDDNSGLAPSEPFRSIRKTLGRILAEPGNPNVTVHLLEGDYYLSDEPWPGTLPLLSGVTVEGMPAPGSVILDAGSTGFRTGAWFAHWCSGARLNRMTIRNSNASAIDLTFSTLIIDTCRFESNSSPSHGGAITASGGQLELRNCIFTGNLAGGNGGAVDMRQFGNLLASDCAFSDNHASGMGGAVSTWLAAGRIYGCVFEDNTASSGGGWCSRYDRDYVLTGSSFERNSAGTGGAVHAFGGRFNLIDCLIADNEAAPFSEISGYGGGAYFESCQGSLISCTITGNSASGFSRIAGGGIAITGGADLSVRDGIIWGNSAQHGADIALLWRWIPASAAFSWSVAGDGSPETLFVSPFSALDLGPGMLYSDPLFVPEPARKAPPFQFSGEIHGDRITGPVSVMHLNSRYRLSSTRSGQTVTSPCIDSGSESIVWSSYMTPDGIRFMGQRSTENGEWPDDGILDMGWHGEVPDCPHDGDMDGDGEVTWHDVEQIFWIVLGEIPEEYLLFCTADLNGDGTVTAVDARLAALVVLDNLTVFHPPSWLPGQ